MDEDIGGERSGSRDLIEVQLLLIARSLETKSLHGHGGRGDGVGGCGG